MGFDQIVVRELVKRPDQKERILASAFMIKCVGALIAWLLMALTWPWLKRPLMKILWSYTIYELTLSMNYGDSA